MRASRAVELGVVVFGALSVLIFWGSSGEGQASLLDHFVNRYVEEKALTFTAPRALSGLQMADISGIAAGTGGDSSSNINPSPDVPTIRESAMMAFTPPEETYLDSFSEQRSQMTEYTVQDGDLISFIASDFGVSVDTVVWANGLKNADAIAPGTVLRIPPVSGVVHTIKKGDTVASLAKKYGVEEARIIAFNRLPQDGSLDSGGLLVVPGGRMPNSGPAPAATGVASAKSLAASAQQFAHLPDLGGYFMVPTTGFNWGRIHGRNGVDMANSCGTPVYSSADGVVTVADDSGYNGGFGKYIKISHANGTETLYAHSMKLLVSVGQAVSQGQKIMLMGTTGRSTGCHLHFEVHGAKNPLVKL